MKIRLFLLLAASLLVGIGAAHAQSLPCVAAFINFPRPSPTLTAFVEPSGLCIQSSNGAARLRWDDNKSGRLELFDTDDGGKLLWCAHLHDGDTTCAVGKSFCLQSDGNAVIYAGDNCTGNPLWASNTVGANINGESMRVGDGDQGFPFSGEKAVIVNNDNASGGPLILVWTSNSSDPS